ncbi:hypothetical protein A3840_08445 [Devosia elaeis]|uniref:ATPase n=2 Tax=Devosia elaeis TaxID=1770058 RepID=A0A178HY83_9HYPH|nr:hypothetical protein A3840_08445 [Devosia elaeis]
MDRLAVLKNCSFGSQVAEDEIQFLENYFVQTDQWNRIVSGKIDIVRGEKGAGKSALYLLLGKNEDRLFDESVVMVSGENPRGATVFKDLMSDPPTSEQEFVVLWKIYLLTVVAHELQQLGIQGGEMRSVYVALEEQKLLEPRLNLAGLLRSAQILARRLLSSARFETGLELAPGTGMPSGIIGRISLQEPSGDLARDGISSLDGMFSKVNSALKQAGYSVWILLDRLDVAFAESHDLEANAIRALIRVYNDFRSLDNISLKIFLREDIWKRITAKGLREASHITRFEVMRWTPEMLKNLIMRRILSNDVIIEAYGVDRDSVLKSAEEQDKLFARIFPAQVEQGPQKATTFNWMVNRCADGTGSTAPRELIHLLNCIREEEIRRLERGGSLPPGEQLFDRSVFKAALPTVSETRLNTYLYAEYPANRSYLEKLEGLKAEQTPESLAGVWGVTIDEANARAQDLVGVGFFEQRGTKSQPSYWVPFLYRDALKLVQGRAED